jgi:hypothetical protein
MIRELDLDMVPPRVDKKDHSLATLMGGLTMVAATAEGIENVGLRLSHGQGKPYTRLLGWGPSFYNHTAVCPVDEGVGRLIERRERFDGMYTKNCHRPTLESDKENQPWL